MPQYRGNRALSRRRFGAVTFGALAGLGGAACKKKGERSLRLQLNWLPEPEFGGFYEAQRLGRLKGVELLPGSPGVPTAQLVASGRVDYAVVSGDEVVRLVAQGADLVAIFASFQRSPRGMVVHQSSPYQSLESLWKSDATVGIEPGQGYVRWLDHQYHGAKLKRVPRPASLATFIEDRSFAQGIYVFAEGAQLVQRKIPVRIFNVADSGYNPYEVVVVTQRVRLKEKRGEVQQLLKDLAVGWGSYLKKSEPANRIMAKLNPTMSVDTMEHAAQLLSSYVQGERGLGEMQSKRWQTLIDQMRLTQALLAPVKAEACFAPAAMVRSRSVQF